MIAHAAVVEGKCYVRSDVDGTTAAIRRKGRAPVGIAVDIIYCCCLQTAHKTQYHDYRKNPFHKNVITAPVSKDAPTCKSLTVSRIQMCKYLYLFPKREECPDLGVLYCAVGKAAW